MNTSPTAAVILAMIADAAEANQPCPTNAAMAEATGLGSTSDPSRIVSELERDGLIRVWRLRNKRVVTIAATGMSTALKAPTQRTSSTSPIAPVFVPPRVRVERDPCSRCGVRADIGCAHSLPLGLAITLPVSTQRQGLPHSEGA